MNTALWKSVCFGGGKLYALDSTVGAVIIISRAGTISLRGASGSKSTSIDNIESIYIEPSQISENKDADGNYFIDVSALGVKFISAEITNREYEKVTPTCYVQGTMNALGGKGTAYIITNVKEPMTINAKTSPGEGTVTFYSDNGVEDCKLDSISGSSVSLNSAYSVYGRKTFVFSGANLPTEISNNDKLHRMCSSYGENFRSNLSTKKVKYTLSNAIITGCNLRKQVLRFYAGNHFYSLSDGVISASSGKTIYKKYPLILNDGSSISNGIYLSSGTYTNSTFFPLARDQAIEFTSNITVNGGSIGFFSDFSVNVKGASSSNSRVYTTERDGGKMYFTDHGESCTLYNFPSYPYMLVNRICSGHSSSIFQLTHVSTGGQYHVGWLMCENSQTKTLQSTTPITVNPLTYTNLVDNIGIYLANYGGENWICFQGDGQLEVTAEASVPAIGTILYKKPDGSVTSGNVSSIIYTAITISPETHFYEGNADGSFYVIKLDLDNVELDTSFGNNGVAFISAPKEIYKFKAINSSTNLTRKILYTNSSGISCDSSGITGSFSTFYNILRGSHGISSNTTGKSISTVTPSMFCGDITHITDDYGKYSAYMNVILGSDYTSDYYMPGCIRIFSPIFRGSTNKYLTCTEKSGTNSTIGGVADLLATEITYPINTVLNNAGYQSNYTTTSNNAVSSVTAAACSKLKSDYSSNIRIYVIKYRKQAAYKTFPFYGITQTNISHSYSTVDACASSSSYLYDISTETDLKNTLDQIAANIKTFAGYADAKNVD